MELTIKYITKSGHTEQATFSVSENGLLSLYEELDTMFPLGWFEEKLHS